MDADQQEDEGEGRRRASRRGALPQERYAARREQALPEEDVFNFFELPRGCPQTATLGEEYEGAQEGVEKI